MGVFQTEKRNLNALGGFYKHDELNSPVKGIFLPQPV